MAEQERVLATCDAESQEIAWQELLELLPDLPQGEWLDTGDAVQGSIVLLEPEIGFDRFAEGVTKQGAIFLRHLAPVQFELSLEVPSKAFAEVARFVQPRLDPANSFAVQTRILGEGKLPFRKVEVNETISDRLSLETGAVLDCRRPAQVVSLLCTADVVYGGLSLAKQNLSDWPGGMHRFKREPEQISRAEFKLLEAASVFSWHLPSVGRALDLGASPGGWTRVLAEAGMTVDAVDPADLAPGLQRSAKVNHFRERTQEFLRRPQPRLYDAIVNDMKMDARASVDLMLQASTLLRPGGAALMTLKMPKMGRSRKEARAVLRMVHLDLERLASTFEVVGARQLYHNRSEVTVLLRSLSNLELNRR